MIPRRSTVQPIVHPGGLLAKASFERVLGKVDLFLFSVSAILTIDSLAAAASVGVTWFTWWTILMIFFFVPYGLMTAEMGAAWPGEGGLYIWVREALGPKWGSTAAWFYWINNAYWIPSVYLVFAGTFDTMFLHLKSTRVDAAIAILLTWFTVLLGTIHLKVSKWIPNVGAVVKALIFVSLGVLGILFVLGGHHPANDFSASRFTPHWNESLAFLPVLIYNALGFELMSSAGEEMRNPQKDVPRVILLGGVSISILYALGALGILFAVPLEKLSLVSGTWDALSILGRQFGSTGETLVFILGLGFLYACIANIVTWSLGVNRVAAVAAQEQMLPAALGALHPRFKTPYIAFIVMGAISTLLLIGNAYFSSNTENVFWMIFKLSNICFLISYLMVFPSFAVLRSKEPDRERPYRMPGGLKTAWAASIVCFAFIAGACTLFFVQAPKKEARLLGAETLLTLVVGYLLIPRPKKG
jgi:amino acid transporter